MPERYYLIDFTAITGGTVRVKAKNKDEALKLVEEGDAWDQIDDQMSCTKTHEFNYDFDKRSIVKDEHQENGPGQDEEE